MEVFDCHTHPTFNSSMFSDAAKSNNIDYSESGLLREMEKNGVAGCMAIGLDESSNRCVAELANRNRNILPIYGVETQTIEKSYAGLKKLAASGVFRGIKLYLGYENVYPFSKRLDKFYRLAENNDITVIFHTGDTWQSIKRSKQGSMVKYSHPLNIDEVATTHPEMKIIIAHSGNPWTEDTAEIVYKNKNCYADISGWFLGKPQNDSMDLMKDKLKFLVRFGGKDKILFGTDWPLAGMHDYINFVSECGLTSNEIEHVLYKNAKRLFFQNS